MNVSCKFESGLGKWKCIVPHCSSTWFFWDFVCDCWVYVQSFLLYQNFKNPTKAWVCFLPFKGRGVLPNSWMTRTPRALCTSPYICLAPYIPHCYSIFIFRCYQVKAHDRAYGTGLVLYIQVTQSRCGSSRQSSLPRKAISIADMNQVRLYPPIGIESIFAAAGYRKFDYLHSTCS